MFSKVSLKLNKYREESIANSPLLFDIKEVSTHFPIVGQPAFQNILTDNENSQNDIPTTKQSIQLSSTQKPKLRRKPKPRRPIITTTEETITESSELQKLSESTEEQTERPRKRQRVRPNYRTSTESVEDSTGYKTTTIKVNSDETSTERSRGRNRYRHRGKYIFSFHSA